MPPRHVLLVEDHEDVRDAVRRLLEMQGHQVDVADDGAQAVSKALADRPEVVLIDIGIPGFDGYEVARRLRATSEGKRMRLVAVSGYGPPADRAHAMETGFDDHLVKPVDPDELYRVVESE